MAEKKKILYIVEAMGGGVFTYIVDLANELVDTYDMYIAYAVRKQTPSNYKDYFDKRIQFIQVLLEANGLAAGKDHQFKGRYDAEKNAVIISLEKDEQSALSPQKCTT